jgi:hypothetical protein
MADEYCFAVKCADCGEDVAVAPDRSRGKGRFIGPCVVHATCGRCGATHEYPNKQVRSVKLSRKDGAQEE